MSRKRAPSDSFDLLLDTICNTFGGVLFIAMLVIVLLNVTGKEAAVAAPDEAAREHLSAAQQELAASQAELEQMQRAAAEQDKLKQRFGNPEVLALVSQATTEESALTATSASRAANLQNAAQTQAQANRIAESLAALDAALAAARQRMVAIEQQLQAERQLRTRSANLPKQRTTSKEQIGFLLRGGRLHAYVRVLANGETERDSNDTQIVTEGAKNYLEPVAGGGTPVDPGGDRNGLLAQKLRGWNPQQHFIAIAVSPDSFEHFPVVRQILVQRGFEYQLMPMPAGERLPITSDRINPNVQ